MGLYSQLKNRGEKIQNPNDIKDSDGLTALHYAARFNQYQIMEYLLKIIYDEYHALAPQDSSCNDGRSRSNTKEQSILGVSIYSALYQKIFEVGNFINFIFIPSIFQMLSLYENHLINYLTAAEPQIFLAN